MFDPKDQFGPAQAVDAEIPLEPARRTYIDLPAALAAKFTHQFAHERDQVCFSYRPIERCIPFGERLCHHRSRYAREQSADLIKIRSWMTEKDASLTPKVLIHVKSHF